MGTIQIDGSTPKITVGNATAEDATILFDGNAQDFYIALDDSADDLLIGLGSTVGTTPAISIDENLAIKTYGDITITGTTPVLTIGDAGAEDTAIVFDGNAQDFYIALDDSADDLLIGKGSTVGTTPAIAIDSDLKVNIPVTTASTSASTGSLTTGGGAGIGADLYVGDDAYLITDSAVLGFGADKDTLLTHTDGTGLTLNSTNKLCFNDASQFVQGSSATVLSIGATDEIDLTATAVDLNGTLDVSGTVTCVAITGSGAAQFDTVGVGAAKDLGVGLHIRTADSGASVNSSGDELVIEGSGGSGMSILSGTSSDGSINWGDSGNNYIGRIVYAHNGDEMKFVSNAAVRLVLKSNGDMAFMGAEALSAGDGLDDAGDEGFYYDATNYSQFAQDGTAVCDFNRSDADDNSRGIVNFRRNGSVAGGIAATNSTVAYNTFCGTHLSQLIDDSKPTILEGTVIESIDTICEWPMAKFTIPEHTDDNGNVIPAKTRRRYVLKTNNIGDNIKYTYNGVEYDAVVEKEIENEKLPRFKISDTEDTNKIYGVFFDWMEDDITNDAQVASIGAFVIRIHKDETVAIGDLLSSKGDGTAKVQADNIFRASTIGKVTATKKIKIHADDSYCVSCTLHCG